MESLIDEPIARNRSQSRRVFVFDFTAACVSWLQGVAVSHGDWYPQVRSNFLSGVKKRGEQIVREDIRSNFSEPVVGRKETKNASYEVIEGSQY